MDKKYSLCEKAALSLWEKLLHWKLPFVSALIFGLMGHMYAFSNKLLNADEIGALFSKGATVTSGRWGLELTSYIFPNVSMPWIYGLISLILLGCSVCVILGIFRIKSPLLQLALSALIVTFPAIIGNFCFMFTSAPYALAIFFALLSVSFFRSGGRWKIGAGLVLLAFSLGIYQAYISLAASLLVICLIQDILEGEDRAGAVLKRGLFYLMLLVAALLMYYAVTFAVDSLGGHGYQEYEVTSGGGLIAGLVRAYTSFAGTLFKGNFGYVNSDLSMLMHLVCLGLGFGGIGLAMARRDRGSIALMLLLLLAFPLSVNCMYLIASVDIIHTLVMFSFISVYVLTAMVLDRAEGRLCAGRDAAALAMGLILAGNIIFCNKVYLKMALQYENAYAFYNSLMAEVMETPGFSEYTVIDFVGSEAFGVKEFDEIDTGNLTGPNRDLVNIYTRVDFMRYYMGLDLYSYREDIIYADWFEEMPSYPDEGSIMMREEENRIIVKLR